MKEIIIGTKGNAEIIAEKSTLLLLMSEAEVLKCLQHQ